MIVPSTDMIARVCDRLAFQYRDSTKFKELLALLVGELVLIRDALQTVENLRSIDLAEGDGLDLIGEILGQPRELSGVVDVEFFELHDGTGGDASEGFGDLTDASAGLRFRSVNESPTANARLGDTEYRSLLKAKIQRNATRATPEDIISSIRSVLTDEPDVELTFGTSSVTATVQRVLSTEEENMLNAEAGIRGQVPVIPRPMGIDLTVEGL